MYKNSLFTVLFCFLLIACNKDDLVIDESNQKPVIELDNETGIYTVKKGQNLTIAPTYKYAEDALFTWTIDGELISSDPTLTYSWSESGEKYLTLRVDNKNGCAQEELKVEVEELLPPVITLLIPPEGFNVQKGQSLTITPIISNSELPDFKVEWIRNTIVVSNEMSYTFSENTVGVYPIIIKASNEDGESVKEFEIKVVEYPPYEVTFPSHSYFDPSTDRTTYIGRPLFLKPTIKYFENPQFKWSVDGEIVEGANEQTYKFTPDSEGEYIVTVTVTEEQNGVSVEASVKVICVGPEPTSLSSATSVE